MTQRAIHWSTTPTAKRAREGVLYAVAAYGAWGLVPLYFKSVNSVPAAEVLGHRIVWSVALLAGLMALRRQWGAVLTVLRSRRTMLTLAATTSLVGFNWFLFIWAVSSDQVLQASLGYYINPLINVLLGLLFLGERLRGPQWLCVALASFGVAWLTVTAGLFPWLAVTLATTFGLYGLLRKTAPVEALAGLSIETMLLFPFALGYLLHLNHIDAGSFREISFGVDVLLMCAGIVTAVPLLWFTCGARRLPLSTMGFLQYLAPTGHFLLGVLVFDEPFGVSRLVAFLFIWTAVILFSVDAVTQGRRQRDDRRQSAITNRAGDTSASEGEAI